MPSWVPSKLSNWTEAIEEWVHGSQIIISVLHLLLLIDNVLFVRIKVVLHSVAKHPYSIAIFENKLYWSDWKTNSIQSCNKFTGKGHATVVKEKKPIYGIHIYHSTLKPTVIKNLLSYIFHNSRAKIWHVFQFPDTESMHPRFLLSHLFAGSELYVFLRLSSWQRTQQRQAQLSRYKIDSFLSNRFTYS